MKQDQEQKLHVCRYCQQSFSNGKKLGGHMRGHLALISASKEIGTRENGQESINGVNGVHCFDDDYDDRVIKKSRFVVDQGYHGNGRKQSIREHDHRQVINGGKGFNDYELIKKSQQGLDIYEEYDANGRKQRIQEHDQEVVNGEKVLDFDYDEKKTQQTIDFDQDYGANVYVLRENPKRSWRVSNSNSNSNSNSSKVVAAHKRFDSRKESSTKNNTVCEKCGKVFHSMKALYGHMRCHSVKKSQPLDESSALSSSEEDEHEDEDEDDDDGVANPVRKKRSCTRYKSPKPNNHLSTSSTSSTDNEAIDGAMNLMMLSRGVRNLDRVKSVISHGYSKSVEKNVVGVDISHGSMELCKFKSNSELGLQKDLVVGYGSGQLKMGRVGSTLVKCESTNEDLTDSVMSMELKKRSKDYKCSVCFKGYVSVQGLARHERVHFKTESKVMETDFIPDVHRIVDFNLREVSTSQQGQCRY